MKAIILAAGRGARMGALTEDAPTCQVPLGGRPLLAWQVAALQGAGCETIGIVRGYKAPLLGDANLVTFDNLRWAETTMVASLVCAADWLRDAPAIVSYADIFYSAAAVAALVAAQGDIAITYDPDWLDVWSQRFADPVRNAVTFRLEGTRVVDLGRRTLDRDDIRGRTIGLMKFTTAGWAAVEAYLARLPPPRLDALDMTRLLAGLIKAGHRVDGVPVVGAWGEVDNAEDLALYERWLADGRLKMAP